MGLIKTIITIAICIAIFFIVLNYVQMPQDEHDCLEEIAEDYCIDNGLVFDGMWFYQRFTCAGDERSIKVELYKFLEDEIEECK